MSVLHSSDRNLLEKATLQAREISETAADKALQVLAVSESEARSSMTEEEKLLRRRLRVVMRRVSSYEQLKQSLAYEQWHRMLFARFLAENELLIHPDYKVAVTLEECAELAQDGDESDRWIVAARFASGMLPGIFPQDDPLLTVKFAPEDRIKLEQVLESLPESVFTSDDGLGWTYQFWQTRRKKEISASGEPISGPDIAAYTQLFTEHYMVQFLLQNTLGAWWLSLHPDSPLKKGWVYYKEQVQHDFPARPKTAKEVRIIDPCCGSGHFLVEAYRMLLDMYREEELSEAGAVVQESEASPEPLAARPLSNLYGLEIDARCVQIAGFALALSAWKAGYPLDRSIPVPNVGCSGLPLGEKEEDKEKTWISFANGDHDLAEALLSLYKLFAQAGELGSLGSLLDPVNETLRLPFAEPEVVLEHISLALKREKNVADPVSSVFGLFADGVVRAFDILTGTYHLAVTNPPFLLRGKQGDNLKEFCAKRFPDAKKDLATCFIERCKAFTIEGGCYALVTPQNWLFLGSDKALRKRLLGEQCWLSVARLGAHAFETITGEVVQVALVTFLNRRPKEDSIFLGIDASEPRVPREKAEVLKTSIATEPSV